MPVYALICDKCKDEWEDIHPMTADHPMCRKGCGVRCGTNPSKQIPKRERQFAGSERVSMQWGFAPDEVQEARQEFDGTGATIRDNGDVEFDSRGQERAFRKRIKTMQAKGAAEKRAEVDQAASA